MNNIKNINSEIILPMICASAALRKEKYLRELLNHSKKLKIKKQKIYEALLQNYLFTGYPNTLNALKIFGEVFKQNKNNYKMESVKKLKNSGTETCKKIYGDKFDKLILNVKSFSPELSEWLVVEGYGKVLSRKYLKLAERELCIIAVLSVLKFEDQLYSHINGAVRLMTSIEKIKLLFNALKIFDKNGSSFGLKVMDKYLRAKNYNIV